MIIPPFQECAIEDVAKISIKVSHFTCPKLTAGVSVLLVAPKKCPPPVVKRRFIGLSFLVGQVPLAFEASVRNLRVIGRSRHKAKRFCACMCPIFGYDSVSVECVWSQNLGHFFD